VILSSIRERSAIHHRVREIDRRSVSDEDRIALRSIRQRSNGRWPARSVRFYRFDPIFLFIYIYSLKSE